MTTCPACGTVNPDSGRFCGQCGTALGGPTCRACGAANPAASRYCGQCGTALGGERPAPSGESERKLATVLFADVVGFTSLAERTDPEVVARLVDGAFRRMAEVVADHGGTVDKFMGDSLMAVFGVPAAHEDDAERAAAAALAMRDLRGELAFSIGVNSGEVMVAAVGGAGEPTVIGDTVNVAARLEKAAGPGEVLCGPLTAELAGRGVRFAPRAPVLLPGRSEPVAVFEALDLRDPTGSGTPPLIGRGEELAFLLGRWRRACRSGRGEVCLVVGEAGVGKTRLLEEVAVAVGGEGGRAVRASYPGYGGMAGPRLAAEVVRQLGFSGDEQVDARVRSVAGELHPVLQVADAVGLRTEQVWALRRLLGARSAEAPVLVVLDDMHRAGPATLELLMALAGTGIDGRVLVVLAGRPEGEWLVRLASVATTLRLGPLDDADAAVLASAVAGGALAPEVESLVRERAGGNPLYVRELVTTGVAGRSVPPTLRALLAARLDALGPDGKAAVQQLAVLGGAATAEQVEALGLAGAGRVLVALADDGVVRVDPGTATMAVADPLLAEVAYEALPHDRRAELHRRAASVSGGEQAAGHLSRAADYSPTDDLLRAEAAAALATTGLTAAAAYRLADAARLLARAVELGHRDPAALLCLARIHADSGHGAEAEAALAALPDGLGAQEAAERDHIRGSARIFSDPAKAVELLTEVATRWRSLGDVAKEAWAHANAGVAWFYRSRVAEAAAELEAARELFYRVGDRAGAAATVSFLALVRPDDRRVAAWLEEALAFGEDTGDRYRQLSALVALAWNHALRAHLGGWEACEQAVGYASRLGSLAGELRSFDLEVHGWSLAAHLARLTGRLEEAERAVAALEAAVRGSEAGTAALAEAAAFAVACAREPRCAAPLPPPAHRDPTAMAASLIVIEALALAGRGEEALERLRALDRPALGVVLGGLEVVPGLVSVLAGAGEEALEAIERAATVAGRVGAEAALVAAQALRAEVSGDVGGLPGVVPDGLAGALVLRARAVHGDAEAAEGLAARADALAAPGLVRAREGQT